MTNTAPDTETRVEIITRHTLPEHAKDEVWDIIKTAWPIHVSRAREIEAALREHVIGPAPYRRLGAGAAISGDLVEAALDAAAKILERNIATIQAESRLRDSLSMSAPFSLTEKQIVESLRADVREIRAISVTRPTAASGAAVEAALDATYGAEWRTAINIEDMERTTSRALSAAYPALTAEIETLRARVAELELQLPAEMQDCIIRFIECEKGHGRLTATNWEDNGCHWCRIERLHGTEQEFPYQATFDAIAYATHIEAGRIAISVKKFVQSFRHRPRSVTGAIEKIVEENPPPYDPLSRCGLDMGCGAPAECLMRGTCCATGATLRDAPPMWTAAKEAALSDCMSTLLAWMQGTATNSTWRAMADNSGSVFGAAFVPGVTGPDGGGNG